MDQTGGAPDEIWNCPTEQQDADRDFGNSCRLRQETGWCRREPGIHREGANGPWSGCWVAFWRPGRLRTDRGCGRRVDVFWGFGGNYAVVFTIRYRPYGGWNHEMKDGYGRMVANAPPLLRMAHHYYLNGEERGQPIGEAHATQNHGGGFLEPAPSCIKEMTASISSSW